MNEPKYTTSITEIAIHLEGTSPIFGETTTKVRLDDEGAGCFIVLEQEADPCGKTGQVKLNPEELPILMNVAHRLLRQEAVRGKK